MKTIVLFISLMVISTSAFANIRRIDSEYGSYYRDTSNDGYSQNNANYLGYNSPQTARYGASRSNLQRMREEGYV